MRKILAITGGVICLLLVILSVKSGRQTSEADVAAKHFWDRMGKQCGDGYYMNVSVFSLSLWLTGGFMPGAKGLTEFRGFSYFQTKNNLTDADKLNGFEWSGRTSFSAKMYRSWESARWSDWQDGSGLSMGSSGTLFKKNGQWFYGAGAYQGVPIGSFRFPDPVNCAEIPQ